MGRRRWEWKKLYRNGAEADKLRVEGLEEVGEVGRGAWMRDVSGWAAQPRQDRLGPGVVDAAVRWAAAGSGQRWAATAVRVL